MVTWLKGNLHAHSDRSDGDASPLEVARWYCRHQYDFLVISDHNLQVAVEPISQQLRAEGLSLLLIPGEEVTTWWPNPHRTLALHVGAIGARGTVGPASGESVREVLRASLRRVEDASGMAILNHPNFWNSITPADLLALPHLTHLEIFNGHPLTYSEGTAELPPVEESWDRLLKAGRRVLGVAVDDAHDYWEFGAEHRNPGRAWVWVAATEKTEEAVMAALLAGNFYCSTGPRLLRADPKDGFLEVAADTQGVIEFITGGEVIGVVRGKAARQQVPAGSYVRGRFRDDSGVAWTQPAFG